MYRLGFCNAKIRLVFDNNIVARFSVVPDPAGKYNSTALL